MGLVRRRPLLRAAAVGGGAYLAGKKHAAAGQQGYEQPQQQGYGQPAPAPAAPRPATGLTTEDTTRLGELGRLHDEGVLTDEEFAAQKSKILSAG